MSDARPMPPEAVGDLIENELAGERFAAVVGEAGVGKSSLVDAMAGWQLVPSSLAVPTRVPTIVRPGRDGAGLRVHIGGEWIDAATHQFDLWLWREALMTRGGSHADTILSLQLPRLATQIAAIELRVGQDLTGSSMSLVDTPGIDAQAPTELAVAEAVASGTRLLLVVVPATAPMSMPLCAFLERFSHKRVVVAVTKISLVRERERPNVEGWINDRLRQLGVCAPVVPVYDAAATHRAFEHRDRPGIDGLRTALGVAAVQLEGTT